MLDVISNKLSSMLGKNFSRTKDKITYVLQSLPHLNWRHGTLSDDIYTRDQLDDIISKISITKLLMLIYIKIVWKATFHCTALCVSAYNKMMRKQYKTAANNYKTTMSQKELLKLSPEETMERFGGIANAFEIYFDNKYRPYFIHKNVRYNLHDKINVINTNDNVLNMYGFNPSLLGKNKILSDIALTSVIKADATGKLHYNDRDLNAYEYYPAVAPLTKDAVTGRYFIRDDDSSEGQLDYKTPFA